MRRLSILTVLLTLAALAAGAKDEDAATLLAVTFSTLHEVYAGIAPPPPHS